MPPGHGTVLPHKALLHGCGGAVLRHRGPGAGEGESAERVGHRQAEIGHDPLRIAAGERGPHLRDDCQRSLDRLESLRSLGGGSLAGGRFGSAPLGGALAGNASLVCGFGRRVYRLRNLAFERHGADEKREPQERCRRGRHERPAVVGEPMERPAAAKTATSATGSSCNSSRRKDVSRCHCGSWSVPR